MTNIANSLLQVDESEDVRVSSKQVRLLYDVKEELVEFDLKLL